MSCLTDLELQRLIGLPEPPEHVRGCERCQSRLRGLRASVTLEVPLDGAPRDDAARPEGRLVVEEGTKVGPYLVLGELGRGGGGIVYGAYHPELNRKVALKLLGRGGGEAAEARLLREAQAMARLSHPNVVGIYDAGVWRGQVYIAMEFIEGETLGVWLARGSRSRAEILQVLLAAGEGLSAAHAAGLVHRDFKPSNVLVDAEGRARITDFGIARSIEQSPDPPDARAGEEPSSLLGKAVTGDGKVLGTPEYLAPEQLSAAPPDPRSDQFSFCVTAFEALLGRRPFETTRAYLAQGTSALTNRPSNLPRSLLETLERGLSIDPARRFPDMNTLLQQLSGAPTRRRWRLVIGGVFVAFSLAVGAAVIRLQDGVCGGFPAEAEGRWGSEVREEVRGAFLRTKGDWAAVAWERTDAAMRAYLGAWVERRRQVCEAGQRREYSPEMLLVQVACLERRLDEFDALAGILRTADAEVIENAVAATTLLIPATQCLATTSTRSSSAADRARVVQAQHRLAEARAAHGAGRYGHARGLLNALAADPAAAHDPQLEAEISLHLGEVAIAQFDAPTARSALERAYERALEAHDDALATTALGHLVSVVGWRLHHPAEGRVIGKLARGLLLRAGVAPRIEGLLEESMGDLEWEAGAPEAATAHYSRAVERYGRGFGVESLETARVLDSLGWSLAEAGRLPEAEASVRHALSLRQRLLGSDHPQLVGGWVTLAAVYAQLERYQDAIEPLRRAIAIAEAAQSGTRLARAMADLAEVLVLAGRDDEAEKTLEQLTPLVEAAGDTVLAVSLDVEVQLLLRRNRPAEAVARAIRAVQAMERAAGAESSRLRPLLTHHGEALLARGDRSGALVVLERALALSKKEDVYLGETLLIRSRALAALGRRDEAVAQLEEAIRLTRNRPLGRVARRSKFEIAKILWGDAGRRDEALAYAREAQTAADQVDPTQATAISAWLDGKSARLKR